MVVRPVAVGRCEVGLDGVLVAGGVALDLAAAAYTLIGLDMRAGRYFLQEHLDRFATLGALEGEGAGWFEHGGRMINEWGQILPSAHAAIMVGAPFALPMQVKQCKPGRLAKGTTLRQSGFQK